MAKAPAYAKFINMMSGIKKEAGDSDFEGCDEILSYMAVKESEDKIVKITELVQSLQFGTGPTVHRKVSVLADRGLIKIVKSKTDARAKDLTLTVTGMNHLKDRTRLLKQCMDA
jgi:DNA-binding MarR family transcriptional regulator